MDFLNEVVQRASSKLQTIVLPEGEDSRIIEAARDIVDKNIARLVILGPESETQRALDAAGVDGSHVQVVDPTTATEQVNQFAERFYELRKHKGITLDRAKDIVTDSIYFGTMMVYEGLADGLVAGAAHSTANTIRPALQLIKPLEGIRTVSSVFFMCFPDKTLVFADCAIVENPSAPQLSDIAVATAGTCIRFGIEPRIAMLSYSTKGSARGDGASKMLRATERAQEKLAAIFGHGSSIILDGEMQFDAAFVADVAEKKCPDSPLKGAANVFIFPDLGAGNICYKAVQRLAGAEAYGPVLQGLSKPVNDLSRGCYVHDIVGTVAITAVQAQG